MMSLTYGIYETQQSENRCIDAEGKWVVAKREGRGGLGGEGRQVRGVKRHESPVS